MQRILYTSTPFNLIPESWTGRHVHPSWIPYYKFLFTRHAVRFSQVNQQPIPLHLMKPRDNTNYFRNPTGKSCAFCLPFESAFCCFKHGSHQWSNAGRHRSVPSPVASWLSTIAVISTYSALFAEAILVASICQAQSSSTDLPSLHYSNSPNVWALVTNP